MAGCYTIIYLYLSNWQAGHGLYLNTRRLVVTLKQKKRKRDVAFIPKILARIHDNIQKWLDNG